MAQKVATARKINSRQEKTSHRHQRRFVGRQNIKTSRKPLKKWVTFFVKHILYTANQETEGSQDQLTVLARIWLAVIDFQIKKQRNQEEIVYNRFIKIPLG